MGITHEIVAEDGHVLSAYSADPAGAPRGAVVVVQEIFGVNGHIRSIVDDLAREGFVAIAPALFDRIERGFDIGYTPEDVTRGKLLKANADTSLALLDVKAAVEAVAPAGSVGIVGYCWGGYVSWMASARVPGLSCAVVYYGGGVPEAADIEPQCAVMGHFGERDSMIPIAGVRKLEQRQPQHRFYVYPADHGFNCDQRGSYDADCAAQARARTLEFFRQYIG